MQKFKPQIGKQHKLNEKEEDFLIVDKMFDKAEEDLQTEKKNLDVKVEKSADSSKKSKTSLIQSPSKENTNEFSQVKIKNQFNSYIEFEDDNGKPE